MASVKQDRLSEGFKDGMSGIRSSERVGQVDWGIWPPTSEEESKKRSKMTGSASIRSELNDNQQEAFNRAVSQLSG